MGKNNFLIEKRKTDARIHWQLVNGLNSWGYTISPAPKDVENNEIESLRKAIDYYKDFGIRKLILQTKYMGSYCSVYLHKEIEKTKFFSRNGYLINHLDRDKLIDCVRDLHQHFFQHSNLEMVIFEGELLPWRALGDGLIDKEFVNYYNLKKELVDYRKEYDVNDKVDSIINSDEFKQFEVDLENGTHKKKYKPHIIRQYLGIMKFKQTVSPIDIDEESLNIYKTQLDIFAYKSETFEFKPFNIIKTIDDAGFERLDTCNDTVFTLALNIDEYCVIDLNDNNCYTKAYNYYNKVSNSNHEGIVVKPMFSGLINIAPCFKVRTNKYLQLIYGVKFNQDFDYYLHKRNTKRKLQQSIKEYEYAMQMVRFEYDSIGKNNTPYTNLLYKLIDSEKFNKTLDNRL